MKKNRIIILTLSLLIGAFVYGQQLVEPAKNYYYNFDNDCAIKTLSGALDISYKDSYMILKPYYVENIGITTRDFFRVVHAVFPNSQLMAVDQLSPAEFIKVFDPGSYIVISPAHTFYIENVKDTWRLIGMKSDYNRKIFLTIKLNK